MLVEVPLPGVVRGIGLEPTLVYLIVSPVVLGSETLVYIEADAHVIDPYEVDSVVNVIQIVVDSDALEVPLFPDESGDACNPGYAPPARPWHGDPRRSSPA